MTEKKWRIAMGNDDAAVGLKKTIKAELDKDPRVAEVIDVGLDEGEHEKYADVAAKACQLVVDGKADRALLFCGTGLGVAISANKVPGIRAVTAHDIFSVERSVLSNDAQVLCMGARVVAPHLASRLIDRWLDLEFDPASHSKANVDAIMALENK